MTEYSSSETSSKSAFGLDNSYDAWAGAGVSWLLRDYLLFGLAGCDVFYNEQGVDLFWKPGGGAAGDSFPVQLSPKGKVAQVRETKPLCVGGSLEPSFPVRRFTTTETGGLALDRNPLGCHGL